MYYIWYIKTELNSLAYMIIILYFYTYVKIIKISYACNLHFNENQIRKSKIHRKRYIWKCGAWFSLCGFRYEIALLIGALWKLEKLAYHTHALTPRIHTYAYSSENFRLISDLSSLVTFAFVNVWMTRFSYLSRRYMCVLHNAYIHMCIHIFDGGTLIQFIEDDSARESSRFWM